MDDPKPTLVHIIQNISLPKIEKQRQTGIRVLTSTVLRNSAAAQDPNIKTSNYLNSLLALQEAKARGGEDAIMCNAQGAVTEGTTFSVFGVCEGRKLITASLNVGILDSITRRHVIESASPELKVEEGAFSLEEFLRCDEAFIASSVREVIPIAEWDGKKFQVPGKVAQLVHQKLQSHIRAYLKTHSGF